jgi:hypothetical protein
MKKLTLTIILILLYTASAIVAYTNFNIFDLFEF